MIKDYVKHCLQWCVTLKISLVRNNMHCFLERFNWASLSGYWYSLAEYSKGWMKSWKKYRCKERCWEKDMRSKHDTWQNHGTNKDIDQETGFTGVFSTFGLELTEVCRNIQYPTSSWKKYEPWAQRKGAGLDHILRILWKENSRRLEDKL